MDLPQKADVASYVAGGAIDDALKAEMLASDGTVTLYAVWAEKDFVSMTFDAGEGSFADDSKEKVESVRPGHLLKNEI